MLTACNSAPSLKLAIRMGGVMLCGMLLAACATQPKQVTMSEPTLVSAEPVKLAPSPEAQQQFATAMATLHAGQTEQAKQQLQQLTVAYPDLAAPVLNLGLIELNVQHYDQAIVYFQQALQRDSELAAAHNFLGVCYRNLGKFQEAEAAYQAAIQADANYADAHLNLGVLYDLYLQQPEQALQEYESYQALQSEPDEKVASWIKEVGRRAKRKAAQGASS